MTSLAAFLRDVLTSARIMCGALPRCCFCRERTADLETHMRMHEGDLDLQRRRLR